MKKMGGGRTSTSSSDENFESVSGDDLQEFYRQHFDESLKKDDKYREKIDKHLRELIADRHELEAEVLRRGEKISDLQKALVDLQLSCFEERERFLNVTAENERLKKNEEKLHENIRHLLNQTKDKELHDKIIYFLQDPKVEIGVNYGSKTPGSSLSSVRKSTDDLFREQIQKLQSKLDEHSKVSQTKSDVILEDCKLTLEKSKEKLFDSEEEIAFLQQKLQDAENELSKFKQLNSGFLENRHTNESTSSKQFLNAEKYSATFDNIQNRSRADKPFDKIHSCATDLHLTLILLSKVINKVISLLGTIQSSQVYVEAAKLPKSKASSQLYIGESDVIQLQNYVRQCTRLSFDVSNLLKSLTKAITSKKEKDRGLDVEGELKELEDAIEELAVATAEADLLCISLSRATFFDYLTGPKKAFEKFGVKEKSNHSKYISDVEKMETNLKSANSYVNQSLKFVEGIIQKDTTLSSENHDQVDYTLRKSLHSSKDDLHSREKFSKSETLTNFDANKFSRERKDKERNFCTIGLGDVTRKINKTLAKIKQLESGEYVKDDEFCKHLAEQVNLLAEKLKEMYSEFNVKDIKDQFSEYSSLTLSKLEALAKQSRSAVIAAEAQITAHRDNARLLSNKLKDTEELLRESINECLVLKQKLQLERLNREMNKTKVSKEIHEKPLRITNFDDIETTVKEVATSADIEKQSKTCGSYGCMYCKQGLEHQLCIEKIDELRTDNRKLAAELIACSQNLKSVTSLDTKKSTNASEPYECMYCKQKLEHHQCIEKIEKLRTEVRKLSTELKECLQNLKAVTSVDIQEKSTKTSGSYLCMRFKQELEHKKCIEKIEELRADNRKLAAELKVCSQNLKSVTSLDTKEKSTKDFWSHECMHCKHGLEHQQCIKKIEDLRDNNRKIAAELKAYSENLKSVTSVDIKETSTKASGPYECMFCKQGLAHRQCIEKIEDLRTSNRKIAAELKAYSDNLRSATSFDARKISTKCGPYECMYCKQGMQHELCIEKIDELRTNNRKLATELKLLKQEIKEDKKLALMNQEQALKTIRELTLENRNLKETPKTLEAKNASLSEQLKLERNRLKKLERFRRLEMEGFQTDIKNLKAKIQDMERQLTKAVLIYEHDKKDLELLKTIHVTAQNSKQATAAIRRLKAKLYELENDIKHL